MNNLPVRKNPRLKDYDYSKSGLYFVTICTSKRKQILSKITGNGINIQEQLQLSSIGKNVEESIKFLNGKHNVSILNYVIMPNHVHLIVLLKNDDINLSSLIAGFKSYTTRLYGKQLWQRSFYDHIIRDDEDFYRIEYYIDNNPLKWAEDRYYNSTVELV